MQNPSKKMKTILDSMAMINNMDDDDDFQDPSKLRGKVDIVFAQLYEFFLVYYKCLGHYLY